MVVPFMFRRTIISVFPTVMSHMMDTDMAIDFTALAGLDRTLTAGGEGAMAGEDMVGIDTEVIYPDQRPGCWYYCNNPKGVGLFGKMLILNGGIKCYRF